MQGKRLIEIDVMKGTFIVLMVLCHLPYFVEKYTDVNNFVYSFHMYGFLLISGFLFNTEKDFKGFFTYFRSLFVPYLFFSSAYLISLYWASSYISTANQIQELSLSSWLNAIFLDPSGTYWYIHTIIICSIIAYCSTRLFKSNENRVVSTSIVFMIISLVISFQKPLFLLFYFIGYVIRLYRHSFDSIIMKTWVLIIPLLICCYLSDESMRSLPTVVCNTFCVIGLIGWVTPWLWSSLKYYISWIGKNSLSILLISPAFTVLTKIAIPFFEFDKSRILWTSFSVIFVIIGCFLMAYIIDKLHFSELCFGKKLIR